MRAKREERRSYPTLIGTSVRRTPRGFVVFELDYVADPVKRQPEWAAQMRAAMGDKRFRQEFLRDWSSAAGDAFYPEFGAQPHKYIAPALRLPNLPICRGWDFGFRHPACVWFAYSPRSDRVVVLREIMPENLDTYSFRDLVLFLSGQKRIEDIEKRPSAMAWVKKIRDDPRLPAPPWFEADASAPIRWLDFSGPEATKVSASVEGEHKERTDKAILEADGITLECPSVSVKAREAVMRRLLQTRSDGWGGIIFDPACRILIEGMNGAIAYPKATKVNPDPTEPCKDGYYEHLHDSIGYGLTNIVPAVADQRQIPRIVQYLNRRPMEIQTMDLGWKETADPEW